jgi:type IV secretion system protein VirB10
MTGVDDIGQSGLEDEVNTHFWRLLSTGLLISELTVGVQNQSNGGGIVSMVGQNGQTTYQNAAGQVLLETAKEAMKPYSVSRPTLIIQEGFPMNIMVNRDLLF